MARIIVKDLQQSDALDRQAMIAIKGGSRGGARPILAQDSKQTLDRVVDYPPGLGSRTATATNPARS
jgi:hypothetical protein